jgi:CRP-like cAMP-binding protein
MPQSDVDLIDRLAELSLFAGLSRAHLEEVAHTFDEMAFQPGERVLRQGLTGSGFYVILEGEAKVVLNGSREIAGLAKGDFFGEVSALLEEPPTADVVAASPLRCLVVGPAELNELLMRMPQVTLSILKSECRRLRSTLGWRA